MRDLTSKIVLKASGKVDNRTSIMRGPHFQPTKVRYVKPGNTRRLNAGNVIPAVNRTPRPRVNVPLPPQAAQQRIHSPVKASRPVRHVVASGPQEKKLPLYSSRGKLLGEATVLAVRHSNMTRAGASRYKVVIEGVCAGWATMKTGRLVLLGSK